MFNKILFFSIVTEFLPRDAMTSCGVRPSVRPSHSKWLKI